MNHGWSGVVRQLNMMAKMRSRGRFIVLHQVSFYRIICSSLQQHPTQLSTAKNSGLYHFQLLKRKYSKVAKEV